MHKYLKLPKVLIFDWDHTLVDNWKSIWIAINKTRLHYDLETITFEKCKEEATQSLRNSFPLIFKDKWQEAKKFFYKIFDEIHLENLKKVEGSEDILQFAQKNNLFISLLSNKSGVFLRKEVNHLNWTHYFNNIVGANDAEEDKPSEKSLDFTLSGAPVKQGKNIWFIGDAAVDIECANTKDCTAILIKPPYGSFADTEHHFCDEKVENLKDLKKIFLNWYKE